MSDKKDPKEYSNPNVGKSVCVEQNGRSVAIIFECETLEKADHLCNSFVEGIKAGQFRFDFVSEGEPQFVHDGTETSQ